jgi:hypothetical protein
MATQLYNEPLGGSEEGVFNHGRAYYFGFHFGQSGYMAVRMQIAYVMRSGQRMPGGSEEARAMHMQR